MLSSLSNNCSPHLSSQSPGSASLVAQASYKRINLSRGLGPSQRSEQPLSKKASTAGATSLEGHNKALQKKVTFEVIRGEFKGQILNGRFLVSKQMDDGSFGSIYSCIDVEQPSSSFVIKISSNYQMMGREIQALRDIERLEDSGKYLYPYDYVPRIVDKGILIQERPNSADLDQTISESALNFTDSKSLISYYVMPRYGRNLDQIFQRCRSKFSSKTIFQLGIRLVEILEKVHEAGYTYNDLKLDNILIGDASNKVDSLNQIRLIDFGFAQRYADKNGEHLEQQDLSVFRGNMIFATQNQFEFKTTSRKDDLLSLCYLMVYLFKQGEVQFVARDNSMTKVEIFHFVRQTKTSMTPEDLVSGHPECSLLLPLVEEIYSYGFRSTPNYDKLRTLLMKCINQVGASFNQLFDWNKFYEAHLTGKKNEIQVRILRSKQTLCKIESASSMATNAQNSTKATITVGTKGIQSSPSKVSHVTVQPSVAEASHEQEQDLVDFRTAENVPIGKDKTMDLNITAQEVNGADISAQESEEELPEDKMIMEASALIYASIETEDCEFLDSDEEEEEQKYSEPFATPTVQKQMEVDRTASRLLSRTRRLSTNERVSDQVPREDDCGMLSTRRRKVSQLDVPVMNVQSSMNHNSASRVQKQSICTSEEFNQTELQMTSKGILCSTPRATKMNSGSRPSSKNPLGSGRFA